MSNDTYESVEAALFATLQAAEYRIPYGPRHRWPLYECAHEQTIDITTFGGPSASLCVACGTEGS